MKKLLMVIMNMCYEALVSLQKNLVFSFCFQEITAANGSAELLEHIWHPRIQEVKTSTCHACPPCVSAPSVPVVPRRLQLLCCIRSLLFSATGMCISPVDLYTISPQACLLIPSGVVTVNEACWLSAEEVWPLYVCLLVVLLLC